MMAPQRVAKAVLVGAVTPLMLKTDANPGGLPTEVFDTIRAGVAGDRSQFFKDLTTPFFGANRPGAKVSQGVRDAFWFRGLQGGLKNQLDCIEAFSETDFTEDLEKFDVPTLIIHGDDDQIVPIGASAHASSKLVRNASPAGDGDLRSAGRDRTRPESQPSTIRPMTTSPGWAWRKHSPAKQAVALPRPRRRDRVRMCALVSHLHQCRADPAGVGLADSSKTCRERYAEPTSSHRT
jgi:hypothetical protein